MEFIGFGVACAYFALTGEKATYKIPFTVVSIAMAIGGLFFEGIMA